MTIGDGHDATYRAEALTTSSAPAPDLVGWGRARLPPRPRRHPGRPRGVRADRPCLPDRPGAGSRRGRAGRPRRRRGRAAGPQRTRPGLDRPDGRGPPLPQGLGGRGRRRPPCRGPEPVRHQRHGWAGDLAHDGVRRAADTAGALGPRPGPGVRRGVCGGRRRRGRWRPDQLGQDRDRRDRPRQLHGVAGAPDRRPPRGRHRAPRQAGLGRRRSGGAGSRVPLTPGAGRRLSSPGPALRRRAGGGRGRCHLDDRRVRRPARRRRPCRAGEQRRHRHHTRRRWRSPNRLSPSAARPAPTRSRSCSGAGTTTHCSPPSPLVVDCPTAG